MHNRTRIHVAAASNHTKTAATIGTNLVTTNDRF